MTFNGPGYPIVFPGWAEDDLKWPLIDQGISKSFLGRLKMTSDDLLTVWWHWTKPVIDLWRAFIIRSLFSVQWKNDSFLVIQSISFPFQIQIKIFNSQTISIFIWTFWLIRISTLHKIRKIIHHCITFSGSIKSLTVNESYIMSHIIWVMKYYSYNSWNGSENAP